MDKEDSSPWDQVEADIENGSWTIFQTNHVPSALYKEIKRIPEDFDEINVGLDLPVFLSMFSKQIWKSNIFLDEDLEQELEELMREDFAFHYSREGEHVFYENEIDYHDIVETLNVLDVNPDVNLYHTDQLGGALNGMAKGIKNNTDYSQIASFRSLSRELNEAQKSIIQAADETSEAVKVTEKISGNTYQKGHLGDYYTDLTEDEIWAKALQKEVKKSTAENEKPLTVMLTYDRGFTKESDEFNIEGDYTVALPPDMIEYVSNQTCL